MRSAIRAERMFNLMHLTSAIKVDFIVRKSEPYRIVEFQRRVEVNFGGVTTWLISLEDLMLSRLAWGKLSGSELQRRDIKALPGVPALDRSYLMQWAPLLGVEAMLAEIERE